MSTHIRRTDGWRETGACRVIFRLGSLHVFWREEKRRIGRTDGMGDVWCGFEYRWRLGMSRVFGRIS